MAENYVQRRKVEFRTLLRVHAVSERLVLSILCFRSVYNVDTLYPVAFGFNPCRSPPVGPIDVM